MVNRDLVAAKLAELADRVARIRSHCPPGSDGFANDRDALDLVSFNLLLAVQICADVASHVIADEGWPAIGTVADAFKRLSAQGVVTAPTASALARAVRLRNLVAHGYSGVDPDLLYRAATEGISDLEAFAREVAAWTTARAGDP